MGFLKSFFGAAAANAIRDSKKQQEKLDKWNSLFDECLDMDIQFNDYLQKIGVKDSYSQRAGIYDEGKAAVNAERRKIEQCKKKIEEFISLGGQPENIWYIDQIDDYIAKLKYMISIGYLEQQDQWIQADMDMLKTILEIDLEAQKIMRTSREKQEAQRQREELVKTVGFDVDTLSGVDFEAVCQTIVEKMGFTTQTTKTTGDGGIDLIAFNTQPLLSGKYIIQCKRYSGSVGEPIIRDLYGVVTSERANKGILMTTGYFTRQAIAFAEGKPLELIDGAKLQELLKEYCTPDKFNNSTTLTSTGDKCIPTTPAKKRLNIPPEYEWLRAELEQEPDFYSDNGNEVDLVSFITIDKYKRFKYWMEKINVSPDDIHAKCRAAEILHDAIAVRLRMGTRTHEEVQATTNLLRKIVFSIKNESDKSSTDEKNQYLYYMCVIIDGEACFWLGHPEQALEKWMNVFDEWTILEDNNQLSDMVRHNLMLSIWTCMNYLGMQQELKVFYDANKAFINRMAENYMRLYNEWANSNNEFWVAESVSQKASYDKLMNPQKATYILTSSLTTLSDNDDSSILLCEDNHTMFKQNGFLFILNLNDVSFSPNGELYYLGDKDYDNKTRLI